MQAPPLKEQRPRAAPAKHPGRVGNPEVPATTHRFLGQFLLEATGKPASSSSPGGKPVDPDVEDEMGQPLDDEALAAVFDELRKAREA